MCSIYQPGETRQLLRGHCCSQTPHTPGFPYDESLEKAISSYQWLDFYLSKLMLCGTLSGN